MRKVNYLFDACVSHRNTQKLNKKLDEFFEEEEYKFYSSFDKKGTHTFNPYPIEVILPLMSSNERAFCEVCNIKWYDYSELEDMDEGRDNLYWILLHEILHIAYQQDVCEDKDPVLEEKREYLYQLFNTRYEDVVQEDIIRDDFCCNNDI